MAGHALLLVALLLPFVVVGLVVRQEARKARERERGRTRNDPARKGDTVK